MRINIPNQPVHTHEGAVACRVNPEESLRRSVMSCLLWEKGFYEDGQAIAERIAALIPQVKPETVVQIARDAKTKMNLRHVPLFIVREMARHKEHKKYVSRTLQYVIRRADELAEFLAIYWAQGKCPLANKVKQGLAFAFQKFSEYELAKYNRDNAVKLRDVLFMVHSKPLDVPVTEQPRWTKLHRRNATSSLETPEFTNGELLYKKIADNSLDTPDTWEVALSSGADKKETFERLMRENKLGALAFIRNLRNMREASVDLALIHDYSQRCKVDRILPYQLIAAAKTNMEFEPLLEPMLYRAIANRPTLLGTTCVLVDVSGSMTQRLSSKSEMTYSDAACAIAILLRELTDAPFMFSFSDRLMQVPPRRGFALRDALLSSQPNQGTNLRHSLELLNHSFSYDRLIVITDEQTSDGICAPKANKAYIMNVASNQFGVGYGQYRHIHGFSPAVIDWINEYERVYK